MNLTNLMEVRRGDRLYTYFRRKGQPLIPLPDLPRDHPDFLAAYIEARRQLPSARDHHTPGTLDALIDACERSERFNAVSAGYRGILTRHFRELRKSAGSVGYRGLRDRHIQFDVNGASSPEDRRKAWRFLCAFGVAAQLLPADPTAGVTAPPRPKTDGHPPWTVGEMAAYRQRWPLGTVPRLAFELLAWTGARISDGVRLGPGMVDHEGVLCFRQAKTGGMAYVPWTCALPPYALRMEPDRDHLMAALAGAPGGHMTFLATAHGRARSDKALGTLIREAAREAEVEKSAHGLRKARAVALAEAGATTHQIGAWTGHESLKEVEHYTLRANRRRAVMGTDQERGVANKVQTRK